ncbi:E3 ubiquitin-protein ligase Zswim2 [Lobulomyces angularis]|nr:E3 ubiquitin-protein ligase Zswim2 [Lobulomyces angularis]
MNRIYRLVCPDAVKKRIEDALTQKFLIVQTMGPMAFLLKPHTQIDETETKEQIQGIHCESNKLKKKNPNLFRICLGSLQSCSCSTFMNERELCVHILWVMLKVYRVDRSDEKLFQLSLVEREITELISQRNKSKLKSANKQSEVQLKNCSTEDGVVRRDIEEGDVCPICQDDLIGEQPTIYCKKSCGNNMHSKCLKVLMEHQVRTLGENLVKCPLCRKDFGTCEEINQLIAESQPTRSKQILLKKKLNLKKHFGFKCMNCEINPIVGKCHKCLICPSTYLCEICFMQGHHSEHSFEHRLEKHSSWEPSIRVVDTVFPQAMLDQLQGRELTDLDYEKLLLLDQKSTQGNIPLHVINSFPTEKIKDPRKREECTICAVKYVFGSLTRKIPCGHSFHQSCIDRWLLQTRSNCPTCGENAYFTLNQKNGQEDEKINLDALEYIASPVKYEAIEKKKKKKIKIKKDTKSLEKVDTNLIEIVGKNNSNYLNVHLEKKPVSFIRKKLETKIQGRNLKLIKLKPIEKNRELNFTELSIVNLKNNSNHITGVNLVVDAKDIILKHQSTSEISNKNFNNNVLSKSCKKVLPKIQFAKKNNAELNVVESFELLGKNFNLSIA